MATISSAWTENQNVYTGQVIGTSASRTDDIDIANLAFFDIFANLTLTFNGAATVGATVEVFGSANSGTSDSTDPVISFDIPVDAGATVIVPLKILPGLLTSLSK